MVHYLKRDKIMIEKLVKKYISSQVSQVNKLQITQGQKEISV